MLDQGFSGIRAKNQLVSCIFIRYSFIPFHFGFRMAATALTILVIQERRKRKGKSVIPPLLLGKQKLFLKPSQTSLPPAATGATCVIAGAESRDCFGLSGILGIWGPGLLRWEVGQLSFVGQTDPLPVFIDKVLLEHNHSHWFTYFLQLHSHYSNRAE